MTVRRQFKSIVFKCKSYSKQDFRVLSERDNKGIIITPQYGFITRRVLHWIHLYLSHRRRTTYVNHENGRH